MNYVNMANKLMMMKSTVTATIRLLFDGHSTSNGRRTAVESNSSRNCNQTTHDSLFSMKEFTALAGWCVLRAASLHIY